MSQKHTAVPASYLILRKGDEVLLMRRHGSGYYDGWYSLPAGHVEEAELPSGTIIREAKEELGIDIKRSDIVHVHTLYRAAHDETGDRADYFFEVKTWEGDPKICEPDKCDDIRWASVDSLPDSVVHHVLGALFDIKKGKLYSELTTDNVARNPSQ